MFYYKRIFFLYYRTRFGYFSAVLLMIFISNNTNITFNLRLTITKINNYPISMNIDLLLILIYFATLLLLYQTPVYETIVLFEQQYILTPATQFIKSCIINLYHTYYY